MGLRPNPSQGWPLPRPHPLHLSLVGLKPGPGEPRRTRGLRRGGSVSQPGPACPSMSQPRSSLLLSASAVPRGVLRFFHQKSQEQMGNKSSLVPLPDPWGMEGGREKAPSPFPTATLISPPRTLGCSRILGPKA